MSDNFVHVMLSCRSFAETKQQRCNFPYLGSVTESHEVHGVKIADKVKAITENSKQSYGSLKDALAYAVQAVARTESLTKDSVRNYTRTIYPDFYDYYNQNLDITPDQLVAMAELIIDKSMYRSMAEKMQHYTKMTQYLAANRPDLLEQIQSVYASPTGSFNNEPYSASQSLLPL